MSKDLEGGLLGREGMNVQRAWARCRSVFKEQKKPASPEQSAKEAGDGRFSSQNQTLVLALGNTLTSSWVPLLRTISRVMSREASDLMCRSFQPL